MALKLKQIKKGGPQDPANWPAIPTLLKSGDVDNVPALMTGYYAVKVSPKGIETFSQTSARHDTFDTCKTACDAHNMYIGMSIKEIAVLYSQRRFEHRTALS